MRIGLSVQVALFSLLLIGIASAQDNSWILSFKKLIYALGWIMMIIMGIKWTVADNASERQDAKKGIIYIVIALLIAASYCDLMKFYCDAASKSMSYAKDSFGNPLAFNCQMDKIFC